MAVNVPIISSWDGRGVQKAIRDFKKLETNSERMAFGLLNADATARKMAGTFAKIGGVAALTGGIAAKSFIDFDSAMNESLAIMGDVTDGMRQQMSQAARQMAKETTFSATQAAESFYFLASAGLNAEQSIGALPRVAKFAQAGMFDMALATTLLADAQSALGLRSSDTEQNLTNLTRVSDVLVKANILANASVQQFSEALTNKAGASMRSLNIDIEEGVAVLATFASVGVKGSEAGTMFNAMIRGMTNGVQRFPEVFKRFNIEVFNSAGAMNNLADIVAQMEKAFDGMSVEQKRASLTQLGFTEETLAGTLALIGNSEAIRNYERDLRDASGTTDSVANNQLKSLSSQITLAKNAFVDLSISLGERLAPMIESVTKVMQTFADIIGEQGIGAGLTFMSGQIVGAIGKMNLFGKAVIGMIAAFAALRVATVTYTATMTALNVITTLSDGALKALIVRLGAAKIAMMTAGGVVAVLSAAAIAYGVYAKRKSDAIQATKNFRDALKLEGEAQEEALLSLYKTDKNYRMHIDTMRSMNITLGETNDYIQTGTGPLNRLVAEWNKADSAVKGIYPKLQAYADALGISTENGYSQVAMVRNMVIEMMNQRKETLKNAEAQSALAMSMGNTVEAGLILQRALGMDPTIKTNATAATDELTQAQEELDRALKNISGSGGSLKKAQQAFADFKDQAESVFSQQKSLKDATKETARAYTDLTTATNKVIKAQEHFNKVSKGYGEGSKEAREARQELTEAEREAERAGYALETANYAVTDAERNLAEARAEGDPRAIREAEIALAEAKLSVRDAEDALTASTTAVTEAQTALNAAINGASTESEVYKTALQELKSAQDDELAAIDRVNQAKIREFEITKKLAEAELALAKIKKTLSKEERKKARRLLNKLGKMPDDLILSPPSQYSSMFGLDNLDLGNIPVLGDGGIVRRPTLAMIGEAGPEAVVPLNGNAGVGGDVYHIQINSKIADETLPDLLVAELRKFNRRSGAINIQVA